MYAAEPSSAYTMHLPLAAHPVHSYIDSAELRLSFIDLVITESAGPGFVGSSTVVVHAKKAMPFLVLDIFIPCVKKHEFGLILTNKHDLFSLYLEISRIDGACMQDPSSKEMAEQIAKDPAFTEMAEQLQKMTVVSPRQAPAPEAAVALDPHKYVATMQQLMQNPQFVAMAERLGSALMQDPAMASMLGGLTNPAHKEQLEARIARMKDDPTLKPILDEIEAGGPAAMMKYWNDPEALHKFGRAMGVGPSSEAAAGAEEEEAAGEEGDGEYEEEEESVIHHTASVGDVEVRLFVCSGLVDEGSLHIAEQ